MLDALAQQTNANREGRAPLPWRQVITCQVASSRSKPTPPVPLCVSGKSKTPRPWFEAERQLPHSEPLARIGEARPGR